MQWGGGEGHDVAGAGASGDGNGEENDDGN